MSKLFVLFFRSYFVFSISTDSCGAHGILSVAIPCDLKRRESPLALFHFALDGHGPIEAHPGEGTLFAEDYDLVQAARVVGDNDNALVARVPHVLQEPIEDSHLSRQLGHHTTLAGVLLGPIGTCPKSTQTP